MPTILVVDDQQCIRELVAEELADEGYRIDTVGDALGAKRYLRSFQPDLVLLDLFLGEPDGWEVLRDIKKHVPSLPVIVFTAYDSFKDDLRLSKADGYVIKSTDFRELKKNITNTLTAKKGRQGDVEARAYVPQISVAPPC